MRPTKGFVWGVVALLLASALGRSAIAQNYPRYKPKTPELPYRSPEIPHKGTAPDRAASDRVLIESLRALRIIDTTHKVDPEQGFPDARGVVVDVDAADALIFSPELQGRLAAYIGRPVSLRSVNQMAREIIRFYQDAGQPMLDVIIPEQRITTGVVQLVVIESRVGQVLVRGGCHFGCESLVPWIACTQPGERIYQAALEDDLFWLSQSQFRRATVDFRPGTASGTTDVIFDVQDCLPIRGYVGYEDTGVRSLNLERFFGGLTYGNLFGRGGVLSYQYTTDIDFTRLHAHAASYLQPWNREWSTTAFGSWAGVRPDLGPLFQQDGESWQVGGFLSRHLIKCPHHCRQLTFGFDFKSTDNNLEFSGTAVSNSFADLFQLRIGFEDQQRFCDDAYRFVRAETFIGPGPGLTDAHRREAFETLRPGTSPDYIYGVVRAERSWVIGCDLQLIGRLTGQAASERLLFSEMLGMGGHDTLRGYDERASSADCGMLGTLELGPRTFRGGCPGEERTLRPFVFVDAVDGHLLHPFDGEDNSVTAASTGVGLRYTCSDQLNLRFDYGHGFSDLPGIVTRDRVHLGLVWLPGPRP